MSGSRLLVMRHAKSDWFSGEGEDFLRPLSARGERDARRMGRWMAAEGLLPARILSSPARRTRETLALLGEGARADLGARTEWVDALYHSTLEVLLQELARRPDAAELMVLGHNPGLEELLVYLAGAKACRAAGAKVVPTGALYVLDLPGGFAALEAGSAAIVLHQRPRALAD